METVLTVVLWTFGGAFLIGIIWALGVASDMSSRETHHDGKPGSLWYDSHKKGDK